MAGVSSLTTGGELRNDFLTLLTTQLRHQDPLSPTNSTEFIGQLSQFTTLERMEAMNSNIDELVKLSKQQVDLAKPSEIATTEDLMQSALLLGRQVDYLYVPPADESGASSRPATLKSGTVESITLKDGKVVMTMHNGDRIKLTDVTSVKADLSKSVDAPAPPRVG
jgi:flagellar basal-body rod modification protein FlgD